MKRVIETIIVLTVWFASVSLAEAINIAEATIQNGEVFIIGNQAEKGAAISWEGVALGIQSNSGGAFQFNTTNLPPDCVGLLKIGTEERDVVIENCEPTIAGLLKTGQTDNFGVTGSDGDLEKGHARSYTVNALTITDNVTGLEWEKLKDDGSINDVDTTYDWAPAFQKIAALNAANFAGHDDWRLPNINELHSLVDYSRVGPTIDTVFRTGNDGTGDSFTHSLGYWSSTTRQDSPDRAWIVSFDIGYVEHDGKDQRNLGGGFVRAVRGP